MAAGDETQVILAETALRNELQYEEEQVSFQGTSPGTLVLYV